MIRAVFLGYNSEKEMRPEEIETLTLVNVWLELVDPQENELQAVSEATEMPISFLRWPKTENYVNLRIEEAYSIINFPIIQETISAKRVCPMVLAFSKNFLVTVATKDSQQIVDLAKERMSKAKVDPPAQVAYFIIDEIVSNQYLHIEKIETVTAKIEEEVVEKTSSDTLKRIFRLKTNMISFNKILWYERGLIFNLRKCGDNCLAPKVRGLFDKTHEDLTRQIDIVETYREILSDAINVHLSAISNKINLSIKGLTVVIFYLTIITTITSFPNTVATFFGISQFGNTNILILATAILASIILPFVWLWRKKWLSLKNFG